MSAKTNTGGVQLLKRTLPVVLLILFGVSCSTNDIQKNEARKPYVHIIEIQNFRFKPAILEANPGDEIRWINRDMVPHHIADTQQKEWKSGDLKTNDRFNLKISRTTSYICIFHPTMEAKIIVKN